MKKLNEEIQHYQSIVQTACGKKRQINKKQKKQKKHKIPLKINRDIFIASNRQCIRGVGAGKWGCKTM